MSDGMLIALVSAVANGLITWGIITTKLAWLRADVDRLTTRLDALQGVLG